MTELERNGIKGKNKEIKWSDRSLYFTGLEGELCREPWHKERKQSE